MLLLLGATLYRRMPFTTRDDQRAKRSADAWRTGAGASALALDHASARDSRKRRTPTVDGT
jgi:hypothetical protein